MNWKYRNIFDLKNHTQKVDKIHKSLSYIKSSCIMFWAKMFGDSYYIFCLQEESTHFCLRFFIHFDLGVLGRFGPRNCTRKMIKFIKIFEFYQVFIHSFLSPNHLDTLQTIYYWHALKHFYHFPVLSVKIGTISCFSFFSFSFFLSSTNHTILLNVILDELILCSHLFFNSCSSQ